MGGGNPHIIQVLLLYGAAGKLLLPAKIFQKLSITLAAFSKAEIAAADKAGGVLLFYQHRKKILPGHSHQLLIKGQLQYGIGMKLTKQLFSVPVCVNQSRRFALYQGIGMAQKGDHAPLTGCFLSQFSAGIQKGLVTKMHPIKIP